MVTAPATQAETRWEETADPIKEGFHRLLTQSPSTVRVDMTGGT